METDGQKSQKMCRIVHNRGIFKKDGEILMKTTKLDKILEKIPSEKRNEADLIVEELEFILETIKDLKKKIKETGSVEHFINGKQDFLRESPALTSYNKLMKTYDTFYKNLINLIPKDDVPDDIEFDADEL